MSWSVFTAQYKLNFIRFWIILYFAVGSCGCIPPLGSSLKLRLSLRVHTDSEAARNVRYSALKGWDLQRQTLN